MFIYNFPLQVIVFILYFLMQVLRKRPNITVHGLNVHKGFSDIAFSSDDNSRSMKEASLEFYFTFFRIMGTFFSMQYNLEVVARNMKSQYCEYALKLLKPRKRQSF